MSPSRRSCGLLLPRAAVFVSADKDTKQLKAKTFNRLLNRVKQYIQIAYLYKMQTYQIISHIYVHVVI